MKYFSRTGTVSLALMMVATAGAWGQGAAGGARRGGDASAAAGPGGRGAGGLGAVAPDERSITLRTRQSMIELPAPGYKSRMWDPRSGFLLNTTYSDWSKPLGEPRETHYLTRYRLEKKNPNAAVSDPVKPITY